KRRGWLASCGSWRMGKGVDWELWRIYLGDIGDLQKCLQYCKRDEYCDHEHEPHKEVSPFIHG
ncbi:MAG: hypothetical protein ACPHP9_14275, partial [bacterium]